MPLLEPVTRAQLAPYFFLRSCEAQAWAWAWAEAEAEGGSLRLGMGRCASVARLRAKQRGQQCVEREVEER